MSFIRKDIDADSINGASIEPGSSFLPFGIKAKSIRLKVRADIVDSYTDIPDVSLAGFMTITVSSIDTTGSSTVVEIAKKDASQGGAHKGVIPHRRDICGGAGDLGEVIDIDWAANMLPSIFHTTARPGAAPGLTIDYIVNILYMTL